jgi:outer membrane protein assembly factor BamB
MKCGFAAFGAACLCAWATAAAACGQTTRPAAPQASAAIAFAASRPSATAFPEGRGGPLNTGRASGSRPAFRRVAWTTVVGAGVLSQPAVVDGRIYLATVENQAVCLDAKDGAEIYSRRIVPLERNDAGDAIGPRFAFAAPLVAFGKIFLGHENGVLYALDAATGEVRWSTALGGKIWAAPKTDGRRLVAATTDGDLHVLDPEDGRKLKSFRTGYEIGATPTLAGSEVFVFGAGGKAIRADLETLQGEVFSPGFSSSTTAAFGFGYLFLRTTGRGDFVAFDAVRREVRWKAKLPGDWNRSGSAFDGERVVFTDPRGVHAFDAATGAPAWSFPTPRAVNSSVVFIGEAAVFGADDGRLYVLDGATGRETTSFSVGDVLTASPAVAGARVFVAGANRGVVAAVE